MLRLLIVGCGDIGQRVLRLLRGRARLYAVIRNPQQAEVLRLLGATPIVADLDDQSRDGERRLRRLRALASHVLYSAPPRGADERDTHDLRLRHYLRMVGSPSRVGLNRVRPNQTAQRLVYLSTSGVYGDAGGAWIDESYPPKPRQPRSQRRLDAEQQLRTWGAQGAQALRRVSVLRVPGIYDWQHRSPRLRLLSGRPLPLPQDDVYTNHIHADDLARACVLALHRGKAQRVINVNDDEPTHTRQVAQILCEREGFAMPPSLPRDALRAQVGEMAYSFLTESRRLRNERLKRELRLKLHYPSQLEPYPANPQPR